MTPAVVLKTLRRTGGRVGSTPGSGERGRRPWSSGPIVSFLLLAGFTCLADPRPVRLSDAGHLPKEAAGPLRVSAASPRYFSDPAGNIVYLAGSHTWNDLVDMGASYPPRSFDFDAYLNFLEAHNHNLLRLWSWEVPWRDDAILDPHMRAASPQRWLRTGPGTDFGGQPRFDLTRLNPNYSTLDASGYAAADRGMCHCDALRSTRRQPSQPGIHPFIQATISMALTT